MKRVKKKLEKSMFKVERWLEDLEEECLCIETLGLLMRDILETLKLLYKYLEKNEFKNQR